MHTGYQSVTHRVAESLDPGSQDPTIFAPTPCVTDPTQICSFCNSGTDIYRFKIPGLAMDVLETPSLPNCTSYGSEILRECSPPATCHLSHVTCHVLQFTCHVSHVMCHLSIVIYTFIVLHNGEASRWRVYL